MPSITPELIKKAREAAGLSTAQAADLVGVTQRAWQLWESGDRTMRKPMWELFTLKAQGATATPSIAEHKGK